MEVRNQKLEISARSTGGREAFHKRRRSSVSKAGVYGSENAGTSNHNAGEIPAHRKTKVSRAMVISSGLVGPKGMARAAPDGHTVNIP